MRISQKCALLAAIIVLVTGFLALPARASSSWNVQPISDSIFEPASIVVDSQDRPHIAYTQFVSGNPHNITTWSPRDGTDSVIYLSWNDTTFTEQTVATDAALVDLVLDSLDFAHLLYKGMWENSGHLMYATWTGSNWNIQDTGIQEVYDVSIALDSQDNPHIAYIVYDSPIGDLVLKYSTRTGASWSTQIVDSNNIAFHCDLKLDLQNNPHIMYQTMIPIDNARDIEKVKYAIRSESSGWVTYTFEVPQENIEFSNMALDQNGYPYFSYGHNVVNWNGSGWNTHSFASAFNSSVVGYDVSFITLDKQSNPCLDVGITVKEGDSAIVFIKWSGTRWVTQTVSMNFGAGPLTLDSKDNPYILLDRGVGGYPPLTGLSYATKQNSNQSVPELPAALGVVFLVMVATASAVVFAKVKSVSPRL